MYITAIKYTVVIIVTLILAIITTKIAKKFIERSVDKFSSVMHLQKSNYTFFKFIVNFVIYSIALTIIFYSIPELRSIGVTILASAGVFTAIIGFAAQEAFSNIISGIFIFIFKPFLVGDQIKVGSGDSGIVEDITLRHTIIKNFENKRIIIPNSKISSEVILNSSIYDSKICNFVEFGISYDSDIDKANAIIKSQAMKHRFFLDNRTEEEKQNNVEPVITRVIGLGDFSINIRAYVWSQNQNEGFIMKTDLYKSVKEEFDRAGIEIPFPYRTIVHKNQ
ncbi:MAG: mechanosensitive ion channel family protein [Ignavibacteriales bacterium]